MDKFRTEVKLKASPRKISHKDCLLALGSCFAVHIGRKLQDYKFDVLLNPFGTLFNPLSIFKLVNQAVYKGLMESMGIVETQGVFHHFDLHSDLSSIDRETLLHNANEKIMELHGRLSTTSVIIYTFGTAIVYELKETGEIVANCHKVPAGKFNRRVLEVEEIVHGFKTNFDLIRSVNKAARVILTVSPVRHQKESFQQNSVSKSILRLACEKIVAQYEGVEYFPAYEIMLDELRDYRFYADDMLHPNNMAIDYIWQKFMEVYFDGETIKFIQDWEKIRKALAHRPFNPRSTEHQAFVRKTIQQLEQFKDKVDINPELDRLKSMLV